MFISWPLDSPVLLGYPTLGFLVLIGWGKLCEEIVHLLGKCLVKKSCSEHQSQDKLDDTSPSTHSHLVDQISWIQIKAFGLLPTWSLYPKSDHHIP